MHEICPNSKEHRTAPPHFMTRLSGENLIQIEIVDFLRGENGISMNWIV